MTIRVLIVDDQALIRAGLRAVLENTDDITVVGEAGDGAGALHAIPQTRPEIVLMDIRMPGMDGVTATGHICALGPHAPRVIVLTTFDLDEYVYSALRAGASGFLLKDARAADLLTAIRAVASGDAVISPPVTRRLLDRFVEASVDHTPPRAHDLQRLTPRERDVAQLIGRGMSNAEIAVNLHIAEGTVKTHVARILNKLGLRDRIHAVVFAYESGLVNAQG